MSKRTFHAAFSDELVNIYSNDEAGFISLINELQRQKYISEQTRIGVESTGTYHLPLCIFLTKRQWRIFVLNPLITSRASGLKLRPVKTDNLDARLIRSVTETGSGHEFRGCRQMINLST